MKTGFAIVAIAAFAGTAAAQDMGGMKMDEKIPEVTQSGPLPAGWTLRPDDPAKKPESVNFVTMGPGMHVTSGTTAAIYWNAANTASGSYTVSAQFAVRSIPLHDAIGLVWGGSDLSGDKESYGYFLVYGDGGYTIKQRTGSSTGGRTNPDVKTLVAKGTNPAIKAAPANGGSASNTLAVKVGADSVRFLVNDVQVAAVGAKDVPTNGLYGFRVNHGISVHIASLAKQ